MTPHQYITLSAACAWDGRIMMTPEHWRARTAQSLIRHGWVRLKADPFKTKRPMLFGRITRAGRDAIGRVPESVQLRADKIVDQHYLEDDDQLSPAAR